jgi:TatD DNase family protein
VTYLDAHNHLHDARFAPHRERFLPELAQLPVKSAVVNGTRESDWPDVRAMADEHPWIIPSFGLHPWYVVQRSGNWPDALREALTADARAAVGEIGLDRWIEGHDIAVQMPVFLTQYRIAEELNRPATIHCIRAWGLLWDAIRNEPPPHRGFLLHAYGGPTEMITGFVKLGAYFSFSPYFLHERKAAQREAFRAIPSERLLVETDAPDLRPPDETNPRPLKDSNGEPINHPANIEVAYRGLASIREEDLDSLGGIVAENFARLFGE